MPNPVYDYISNLFSDRNDRVGPYEQSQLDAAQEGSQATNDKLAMNDYGKQLDTMASTPNPMPSLPGMEPFTPSSQQTPLTDIAGAGSLDDDEQDTPPNPAQIALAARQPTAPRQLSSRQGYSADLSDDAIKHAQKRADQQRRIAMWGEVGSDLANSISGSQQAPENSFFKTMRDQANTPVDRLLQRRTGAMDALNAKTKMSESDPDSELSQNLRNAYRPMLTKLGLNDDAIEGASAGDLKNFFQNPVETMMKLKTQQENKQLQLAQIKANKDIAMGEKTDKRFTTLGEALDENKARSGEFGRQQQMVNNADRVLALKKQFPDGNLPPGQMAELAGATASLISGGSHPAEGIINQYLPPTLSKTEAGITQWLTSNPKGAGQQKFAQMMFDTAQREKELAFSKVNSVKLSRVADFKDLAKKDPDRFNVAMQSHGINPKDYAAFVANNYQVPSGMQQGNLTAQDEQAIQWAKANQNDPRAAKILSLHGL
jgi:hypothetical protein